MVPPTLLYHKQTDGYRDTGHLVDTPDLVRIQAVDWLAPHANIEAKTSPGRPAAAL
jgi:hypothetical protein